MELKHDRIEEYIMHEERSTQDLCTSPWPLQAIAKWLIHSQYFSIFLSNLYYILFLEKN